MSRMGGAALPPRHGGAPKRGSAAFLALRRCVGRERDWSPTSVDTAQLVRASYKRCDARAGRWQIRTSPQRHKDKAEAKATRRKAFARKFAASVFRTAWWRRS
jgi:hypothetical protein